MRNNTKTDTSNMCFSTSNSATELNISTPNNYVYSDLMCLN